MNKKLISALVLIALCVVVLVVNRGTATVNVLVTDIRAMAAFVYLGFIAVGVAIGVLLK